MINVSRFTFRVPCSQCLNYAYLFVNTPEIIIPVSQGGAVQ